MDIRPATGMARDGMIRDEVFSEGQPLTEMPRLLIATTALQDGCLWIIDLIKQADFAVSNSQARRLVRQKAVSLNERTITDEMAKVAIATGDVLRVGKRRFARIQLSSGIRRLPSHSENPSELAGQNQQVPRHPKRTEETLVGDTYEDKAAEQDALQTDVLTTTEAFHNLRSDWDKLILKSDIYSPFMMWEWLYPWWQFFGHNKHLRLLTVRDGQDQLVGLAPMMLGFTENGRCDRRILAFAGSGEEGLRGQYFSFIVARERCKEILRAIVRSLRELSDEWRIIRLWRMRQDDTYHAFLDTLAEYYDMECVLRRKGAGVWGRDNLRKKYGNLQHDVCNGLEELPGFLSTIHQLNIRRQRSKGATSSWLSADKRACLDTAAQLLFTMGRLRVELLRIGQEPVAGAVGIVQNGTYFGFELGIAPEFAQEQIGHVLLGLCIRDCIRAGLTRFDFLSDHDYLRQYSSDRQAVLDLTVFDNSSPSLRYIGSHLWGRGLKIRIKEILPWQSLKQIVRRATKR